MVFWLDQLGEDCGIVDQNVNALIGLQGSGNHQLDARFVGHVRPTSESIDFRSDLACVGFEDVRNHHPRPFGSQAEAVATANPTPAAGDDRHFSRQSTHGAQANTPDAAAPGAAPATSDVFTFHGASLVRPTTQ
jgi:hypothetical protein